MKRFEEFLRYSPFAVLGMIAIGSALLLIGMHATAPTQFDGKECVAALHVESPEAPYHNYLLHASGEVDVDDNDSGWVRQGSIHGSIPQDAILKIFTPACSLTYCAEGILQVITKDRRLYRSYNWGRDWEVVGDPKLAEQYREFEQRFGPRTQ